MFTLIF